MLSASFAERMVNIAGLEYGDTVVCMGDTGSAIESAVVNRGALLALCASDADKRTARNASRLFWPARSDAVLWAADLSRQNALAGSLTSIGRHLRRGGRLVMWATQDSCLRAPACPEPMQGLLAATGFISVIVGQISSDIGDRTVATGILGANAKKR